MPELHMRRWLARLVLASMGLVVVLIAGAVMRAEYHFGRAQEQALPPAKTLPGSTLGDAMPNIVVILADDLGWNDVGYHGSEIDTPRIDALAEQSVVLDRFYAQPSCTAARAALMTGKSPVSLGILSPLSKLNPRGLPLEEDILPEYLQSAGYETLMVGKWHLGFRQKAYLPTSRGFDYFYGHVTGGIGYWDHVHGGGLDWQRNGQTLREEGYSTHLLADDAVRVIRSRDKGKPMFLYTAFNAPHLPNEAPAASMARYESLGTHRQAHAAMVTELDMAIGRVIDTLDEEGMLENTLIWFMSDNGGLNKSVFPKPLVRFASMLNRWFSGREVPLKNLEFLRTNVLTGGADNTPFRKGKRTVYEGGVRVPSFVYWQGKLEPLVSEEMVTIQDVLPTLLQVVGIRTDNTNFDGVDQWSRLSGAEGNAVPDYVIQARGNEALYRFPWKLIMRSSGEVELYNLQDDPAESKDIAGEQRAIVSTLQEALAETPRGESVHTVPVYRLIRDNDYFGGDEVYPPWTDVVQ